MFLLADEGLEWLSLGFASATLVVLLEIAGVGSAVHAIMQSRTSQGAIAWAVCLVSFPLLLLALPA